MVLAGEIRLVVRDRDGVDRALSVPPGRSLMEVIRDLCPGNLAAICGGCLSCGTCHVSIDPDHAARLPPPDAEEDALLDRLPHRFATSRLSCQIRLVRDLDGLAVTVPP